MRTRRTSPKQRSPGRPSGLSPFVDMAVSFGADDAKVIDARTIKCEAWVRLKCWFGCGGYGKRLTCPPFTPTPAETARVVACYRKAILVHARDNDCINRVIPRLERRIFLSGYYKALGLGSGPCYLCRRCDTGGRCLHPDLARPAMEACGINVFATARANGFEINVVKTLKEKGNYFGVVLVE